MAHRRFKDFHLGEISAVDHPAQKGALATIMKRDGATAGPYLAKRADEAALPTEVENYLKRQFSDDERQRLAGTGAAMPDGSFPIENRRDLRNAVRAFGRAKNKARAKSHIISRARSMGATSLLPDDWNVGKLLKSVTNAEAVTGFQGVVDAFHKEQTDAGVSETIALEKSQEFANALLCEVSDCAVAMKSVAAEIDEDAAITNKSEVLQESFSQFKRHIQGITPEGIDNGLVKAALAEVGFEIDGRGALAKRETDMGFDIRKALGLSATATDADIEKSMTAKLAAFGAAETTQKTLANILKMSATHTAFMNNEKAKMPDGGKEAFANMSPAEREAHMKSNPLSETKAEKRARIKAARAALKAEAGPDDDDDEDDEDCEKVLKIDGNVIRKSEVGESVFKALRSQQEQITKAQDAADLVQIEKRATSSMGFIGKAAELAGLIQKIAKFDGALSEGVAKKFEQLNETMKKSKLFDELGKSNGGGVTSNAREQITKLAEEMVKNKGARTIFIAKSRVREQNPDLAKQEQDEMEQEKEQNKRRAA